MRPALRKLMWLRFAIVAVLAWSLTATLAVAATAPGGPGGGDKSYVIPYMLVILAMALGLMIVCRSSNRSSELKRSDDDD
jgi:fatty acid desaturase